MCVLRGRGTCERPWSNNGWVVVLSVHVPTDPIRSQACGTFVEHSGTFLESFLGSFHRNRTCGTFLEHSGTFLVSFRRLRHAERSFNIPEHSSKASWNIPEHSSDVRNRTHTSRTASLFLIVQDRSDPVRFFFFFFFPLSFLLFSFLFFLRNRPYQADSTTSRPICEVKLPRARVVLRWGTTWEVRVLILLRVFNARFIIINLVLPFFSFFFYFLNFHFVYLFIFSFLIIAHDSCFWLVRNADKIQEWQCKICCHPGNWSARVFCRNVARR